MASETTAPGKDTTSYNDNWNLDSDIVREVTRKDDDQIHTRVMIEDSIAQGYHIDTVENTGGGSIFGAIDTKLFIAQLSLTHPEVINNNDFVTRLVASEET